MMHKESIRASKINPSHIDRDKADLDYASLGMQGQLLSESMSMYLLTILKFKPERSCVSKLCLGTIGAGKQGSQTSNVLVVAGTNAIRRKAATRHSQEVSQCFCSLRHHCQVSKK